jgi:hypothetical protein
MSAKAGGFEGLVPSPSSPAVAGAPEKPVACGMACPEAVDQPAGAPEGAGGLAGAAWPLDSWSSADRSARIPGTEAVARTLAGAGATVPVGVPAPPAARDWSWAGAALAGCWSGGLSDVIDAPPVNRASSSAPRSWLLPVTRDGGSEQPYRYARLEGIPGTVAGHADGPSGTVRTGHFGQSVSGRAAREPRRARPSNPRSSSRAVGRERGGLRPGDRGCGVAGWSCSYPLLFCLRCVFPTITPSITQNRHVLFGDLPHPA